MSETTQEAAPRRHVTRGVICALTGGVFWGFSGTCAQLLMSYDVPAAWITCVRMLIAAVFFLALISMRNWRDLAVVFRDWRSVIQIVLFGVFGVAFTQMSYLFVIGYTNAGIGTTFEQVGLVFIMLYVCLRDRRMPKIREVGGLALALGGMLVIATQGEFGQLAIPTEGLVWGFVSAVALAFYTLIPIRILEKWGAMLVTGLAMLIGGLVSSVIFQPWDMPVKLSGNALAALVAIVLVGTLGAYMLYLQGIKDAGPVKASLLCCIEPVSATLLALFWLHAPVSGWDILGCAMIVAMIFLVTEREPKNVAYESAAMADYDDPPLFAGRASVLGYYSSRPATRSDFDCVSALLDVGHQTFAELGIDEGHHKKYPSSRRLMHSIKNQTTHVIEDTHGNVIAMFALSFSPDKNYENEIDGAWLTEATDKSLPYAELHWVVVDRHARHRGVGRFILDKAEQIARAKGRSSIRADVYPQNIPMQKLLEKHGYKRCGTFVVHGIFEQKKQRIAYESLLRTR